MGDPVYIVKNAWKSIVRNKGRNLLIGVVVTLIAAASCVALSIRSAAQTLEQTIRSQYDITATITMNRDKLMENAQNSEEDDATPEDLFKDLNQPTVADIQSYADSGYVKSYAFTVQANMSSSDADAVQNSGSDQVKMGPRTITLPDAGKFTVLGVNSDQALSEFTEGTYTITAGSVFDPATSERACVISSELADTNDLQVGDTITLYNPNNAKQSYAFTVTGIFKDNSVDATNQNWYSRNANNVYTSYAALAPILQAAEDSGDDMTAQVNSTFHLTGDQVTEAFQNELYAKGLDTTYAVSDNVEAFQSAVSPLTNIQSFAKWGMVLILAVGGSILLVLNMINIRERKYEIGVLRAIGMKKARLWNQLLCELFLVTALCMAVGTGIGAAVSVPTANQLMAGQIASQQAAAEQQQSNLGRPGQATGAAAGGAPQGNSTPQGGSTASNAQAGVVSGLLGQINAVVNLKVVWEIAGIGLLLTLFGSAVAFLFISRYEPLRILSERS